MKKRNTVFAAMGLCVLLLFGTQPKLYGADTNAIKIYRQSVLSNEPGDLVVSGAIPLADGFQSVSFQRALNSLIRETKDKELLSAGDNVQSIDFSYEMKSNKDIVSLLLYVTVTAGTPVKKVFSFNFDATTEKMITLTDSKVLGANGVKIVNKAVLAKIKANPGRYNASFSGVSDAQDFYMEEDTVTVLFDDFEIAPGYEGMQAVSVALRSIKTITLGKEDYATRDDYDLKMIPLRKVIEGDPFHYRLEWHADTKSIVIRKNGVLVSRITVGLNQYSKGQPAMVQLEAAPEILPENGRTVVPISFFEEILDLSYAVDSGGRITFSQYTPPIAPLR